MGFFDWFRSKAGVEVATHTSTMDVTVACPQCGSTSFKAPAAAGRTGDRITCAQCGTSIDVAAETRRLEDEIRQAVVGRVRR